MPLEIAHKSFVINRASGNQDITGIGISGKAFIFYGVGTSGNTLASMSDNYYMSIGFAEVMSSGNSLITQRFSSMRSVDNLTASEADRRQGLSGCITYVASGAQVLAERRGNLVAVSGDGFTINWVNIHSSATLATSGTIQVDVFGGSDIVNAKVGSFIAQSGHGNQTITGVGFSGNIVFFHTASLGSGRIDTGSGYVDGAIMYGCSTEGSGRDISVGLVSEDAANIARTWKWMSAVRCIHIMDPNDGTAFGAAQLADGIGFNSDGFTLNWTSGCGSIPTMSPARDCHINYLVLKVSGNVETSNFDMMSGTGNMSTSGVGFSGKWVQMFSWNLGRKSVTVSTSGNRFTMGGATSNTQRGCIWVGDEGGANTMINARDLTNSSILVMADELATGSGSTVMLDADFVNFHSDGFTINRVTNVFSGDFSGASVLYAAIGDTIAAASGVAEQDITRRAFGGGHVSSPVMVSTPQFGAFKNAETDNRPIFGPINKPNNPYPNVNFSGQLM